MRIPPSTWLCGGDPAGTGGIWNRLMAEYAGRGRYVRAAAQGFSPEAGMGMLRKKARREHEFRFLLESRTPFSRRAKGGKVGFFRLIFSGKRRGVCRNESFSGKNRRNKGNSSAEFFAIAFLRRLLYCIMVFLLL